MTTVYVLECSDEKYYIGKTARSVDVRFEEHRNGSGSEWTWLHHPIRIVESEKTDNFHLELNKTLDYMNKYGIDNVRGSCYSNVNLSETERQSIHQYISSRNDTCYKCGKTGHFANNCNYSGENANNNNSYGCFKCGCTGHFANDCNNYSDESDSSCDENDGENGDDNFYRCYKCGSPSHFANNCNDENGGERDYNYPYRCFKCGSPNHFANNCGDESDSPYDENNCYSDGDDDDEHFGH